MDIAEIRKKAKAKEKAPQQDAAPATASTAPAVPAASGTPDDLAPVPVSQPPAGNFPVAGTQSDALDRLFEMPGEFSLATEDIYDSSLEALSSIPAGVRRQYLAFYLADEEYGLDITQISEIIKLREFTDIPRAPEFILGIISLRGVVVPVFDLRRRLNLGIAEMMPTSRIVVSKAGDVTVGLLVDSIRQVIELADDDLEPPPGVLSGLDRDMVAAIGRTDGRMVIILNVENVLNAEMY